ncbi:MAG: Rieske 2Fe-2S domain-containing protein [Amphritea sp.]|nr:Rieske 2Fe-2S domain-containing protein [Amphritea sp.]MBQ0785575.1 Rieske 2Fe-2S domain-containing protein [Amphritea sp.]
MKTWHLERNAPETGTRLCRVDEVSEDEVVEFKFGDNIKTLFRMFLYNDQGQLRAYMNVCPHFNVPLNVSPGEMFTSDRAQFMCSIHYAKFNLNDGHCTDGPCEGLGLEVIPLDIINNEVFVGNVA